MELLKAFSDEMKDISKTTLKNYQTYIKQLPWTTIEELKKVPEDQLVNTINKLLKKEKETGRVMMRAAYLRILLMTNKEHLKTKIPKYANPPRKIAKKFLTFEQIKKCADTAESPQIKILIMLQYDICCRISAILPLKRSDITFDEHTKLPKIIYICEQKTKRIRAVVPSGVTSQLLKEYVTSVKGDRLFSLTYGMAYRAEKKVFKKALGEYGQVVSSHWFRGSRAVHLFLEGHDVDTVRRYGDWSGATVLRYLSMSGVDADKVMKESTPKW